LRRPRGEEVDDTCGDGGESGVEHMEAPGLSSTNGRLECRGKANP
jgi:hypothetical protein